MEPRATAPMLPAPSQYDDVTTSATKTNIDPRRRTKFRADIQALRALAVMLVVLNHLWPWHMPGGYVGVDVFFVISGFLITAHLMRELDGTGRVRLGAFYARRVRRLLPAAMFVLAVSGIAALVWLPYSQWRTTGLEILASTFYIENWVLADKAVDYFAQSASASIAQHYWSLSVEEQFYLVWPLVMMGLVVLALRLRVRPQAAAVVGLGVLVALGLAASVFITATWPEQAYFVTPTRVWEFAAGGLLALVAARLRIRPLTATFVGVLGFVLILIAARTFDAETTFPGWAAVLPVVGTVLVIAAGTNQRPPLWQFLGFRPVQYLGSVSYSLYLWHWPLIVIAPFALGSQLGSAERFGILGLSIVLAAVTKVLVEDRGQRWEYLRTSSRHTFVALACAMVIVSAVGGANMVGTQVRDAQARALVAESSGSPCYGPRAVEPSAACDDPYGPALVPIMSTDNDYRYQPDECTVVEDRLTVDGSLTHRVCDFSRGNRDAETAWIVGDSHALHWQHAVFTIAEERGWQVKTTMLGGCPIAEVPFIGYRVPAPEAEATLCMEWAAEVTEAIKQERPDHVFTSSHARAQLVDDGSDASTTDQLAAGFARTWSDWANLGAHVYVIADVPLNSAVLSPECSFLSLRAPARCAADRDVAQPADPLVLAAESLQGRVHLVDFTDYMCDENRCYTVVGGVSVYYDNNHINREFAHLLAPVLAEKIA